MSAAVDVREGVAGLTEELRKIPAFFRRDLLVMWSYRLAFLVDWVSMLGQVLLFFLIGRLVSPVSLPRYGGQVTTYVEFVTVGIALASFLQVTLTRLPAAVREAQLTGTFESVLVTPTASATWQLGSVAYDLAYVPVRTFLFLLLVSGLFGADISLAGIGPAVAALLVFVPFAWGLGMMSAGSVLAFRRGGGAVGMLAFALVLGSNTYFPLAVLPGWVSTLAELNPLTITLDAMRGALLGDAGWGAVWPATLAVVPMSAASMAAGMAVFRLALRRERRLGTLGLY